MTDHSSFRWVGPVSLLAATLIIVSQGLHLGLGLAMVCSRRTTPFIRRSTGSR
jgi:hypothetical protein